VATTATPASATEKALHWAVAAGVAVLLASGAVLYVPALSDALGQRFWVRSAHLAGAAALALAPLAAAALRWRELRALERALNEWTAADRDWFLRPWRVLRGRWVDLPPRVGRFNAGQKLFAALVAAALAVLLVTGVPMYWWSWFAAPAVARSRDVHVVATFALTALLAGHVYLAAFSPRGLFSRRSDSE
jgi:formate dehydrogenase subunit gamma